MNSTAVFRLRSSVPALGRLLAVWLIGAVLGIFSTWPSQASAQTVRGSTPWAIILCKPSDRPNDPVSPLPPAPGGQTGTPQYFEAFLTEAGAGTGGLADYFRAVSYGSIDLAGSVVKGWYTMSSTAAQENARSRDQVIQDCVDTAQSAPPSPDPRLGPFTVPSGYRTIVVTNGAGSSGGPGTAGVRVLLDAGGGWDRAFMAHEMGHGYDLDDSFDDTTNNCGGEATGRYCDPWDLMSCVFPCFFNEASRSHRFGVHPPGMNALNLEKLGWLPEQRIFTFKADGASSGTVTLAALNHPEVLGNPLLLRVRFDPADPSLYYRVEFRKRDGWDAGIPEDIVLIHGPGRADGRRSLLRSGVLRSGQTFSANGVTIKVDRFDSAAPTATITVGHFCGGVPCFCGDTLIADRRLTSADPVVNQGSPCPGDGLIVAASVNLDLGGHTIAGTAKAGVGVLLQSNSSVKNGRLQNFDVGIKSEGSITTCAVGTSLTVTLNRIGIDLDSDDCTITKTTVTVNESDGVMVRGDMNKFVRNVCSRNGGTGLIVEGSGNELEQNRCERNSDHGILVDGKTNILIGNLGGGNGGSGVRVVGDENSLSRNQGRTNGGDGIRAIGSMLDSDGRNYGAGNPGVNCEIDGLPTLAGHYC